MTAYKSFKELADHEVEGQDYRIRIESRDPRVLIMAPHGGKIEPATAEVAEAIAGMDYSFYSFDGLKQKGIICFILRAIYLMSPVHCKLSKRPISSSPSMGKLTRRMGL